jgi:hypothetical protein
VLERGLEQIAGSVQVVNAHGMLVANIAPGKALELEAQAAGAGAMGKRVEITGTLDTAAQPVAWAAQTIRVIDLKVLAEREGFEP